MWLLVYADYYIHCCLLNHSSSGFGGGGMVTLAWFLMYVLFVGIVLTLFLWGDKHISKTDKISITIKCTYGLVVSTLFVFIFEFKPL